MKPEYTGAQPDHSQQDEIEKRLNFFVCSGCIVVLLVGFLMICIPNVILINRARWDTRARFSLKEIGRSQEAFFNESERGVYGDFEAVRNAGYIREGLSLDSMVENYTLTWDVANLSTVTEDIHTFTIIAYPRDTRPGFLSTFVITEDQKVRIYDPDDGNDFTSIHTWDPIL